MGCGTGADSAGWDLCQIYVPVPQGHRMSALDALHLPLRRMPFQKMPPRDTGVLLGIMSHGAARRETLRCSLSSATSQGVRPLFVVGNAPRSETEASDVLHVNVSERLWHRKTTAATATGSLSTAVKLMHFLIYAAKQTESIIARAEVCVKPRYFVRRVFSVRTL